MVELAIVLPVLVTVFMGAWTAADLIVANNTTAQASRAGARLGAELGNGGWKNGAPATGCQTTSNDPCILDSQIINQVLPLVFSNGSSAMSNAVVTEVDIYRPGGSGNGCSFGSGCPPDNGAYVSGDKVDVYNVSSGGVATRTSWTYGLDLRNQVHPSEAELGVRVVFNYTSPTLKMFNQTGDSQYTVVRLAPIE
jgi:Flp pilus assembly protein TadG